MAAFLLLSCNRQANKQPEAKTDTAPINTTDRIPDAPESTIRKTAANDRFQDVVVQNVSPGKFRVKGKAQIFEANFSWRLQAGNKELTKGIATTDAGAPEWGNFDFTIEVPADIAPTAVTLILFEISAKDGSPQHELEVPLG